MEEPPPPGEASCEKEGPTAEDPPNAWEHVKDKLRQAFYESVCPEEGLCVVCEGKPDILVTCRDCSRTGNIFCKGCAVDLHKQHCLLHTLVEWQVSGHVCIFSYEISKWIHKD